MGNYTLRCFRCGTSFPSDPNARLCPLCSPDAASDPAILDVEYDYSIAVRSFPSQHDRGIFRYRSLLPIQAPGRILPTGETPLVAAPRLARKLGLKELYLKDERRSATQCLKDRATAVAVSIATSLGKRDVYCASAGNAAISLAGYCAYAGLRAHVFVPRNASPVRLGWLNRFGADVTVSDGDYDQAYEEADAVGVREGWYSRNCAYNPFLVEGKKTASFEIADDLPGAPDWVVAPVGDGCTLGALGKGFRELAQMGRIDAIPRLLGAQAEAMQPMVRRFLGESGQDSGQTAAASINVRRPRNALRLLSELRASNGLLEAVTEEEIGAAQRQLAELAGVVAEFTSATTLAALAKLAERESMDGKVAVLVITGGRVD